VDFQQPPAVVEVKTTERHDIKEETIEHVARLLARAEGVDPDADMRYSLPRLDSMTVTCDAVGMQYPTSLAWNNYRRQAEKLLRDLFAKGECHAN
jgi:hypothetical protein